MVYDKNIKSMNALDESVTCTYTQFKEKNFILEAQGQSCFFLFLRKIAFNLAHIIVLNYNMSVTLSK
jgi:hypothetical protein